MYCTNCGSKLKSDENYCTSCGNANNNDYNKITNNIDKSSIGLIILSFMFPIVGFILFLSMKNAFPKSAKSYGKSALISFVLSSVLGIICFFLGLFFSFYVIENDSMKYNLDELDEVIENDYDLEDDISYFYNFASYYAKLAIGQFYKDMYLDDTVVERCYDVDELGNDDFFEGSIKVSLVNGEEKVLIWLTDYEYYIAGVDYDVFSLEDIKVGDKIDFFCNIDDIYNSL